MVEKETEIISHFDRDVETMTSFAPATKLLSRARATGLPVARSGVQVRFQHAQTSAFVFHPNMETVEADIQMFLWTKTQELSQPSPVFSKFRDEVDLGLFQPLVEKHILTSRYYESKEIKRKSKRQPKDLTRGTHENFPFSLVQNIIKTALISAYKYPQVRGLNVVVDVPITAVWKCEDDVTMTVRGRPGMWLNSAHPLPQLFDQYLMESSKAYSFEWLGPNPLHYNLQQYQVKELQNPGFTATNIDRVTFPYLHTMIILDNGDYIPPPKRAVPEIQLLQKGLMYTFGRLLTQAVWKYGKGILGQVLPEPECAQCFMTDGERFSFLWYQLNTLDLSDLNSGVKNLVYMERLGRLFSSIEDRTRKRKVVKDLDEGVLRTIISQLLFSTNS